MGITKVNKVIKQTWCFIMETYYSICDNMNSKGPDQPSETNNLIRTISYTIPPDNALFSAEKH